MEQEKIKKVRKSLVTSGFFKNPVISFSVLRANIANRKRYRFGKPRNHNGFWVFYANFQDEIQKISFPQNDLWGGLELKLLQLLYDFDIIKT